MISRSETQSVLAQWLEGKMQAEAVWQWAMKMREQGAPEDGLVRDIVDVLASLPYDLVVEEDAEVMAYCLANPPDEADLGQNLLWNHLDGIDSETRRVKLADDPFYGPYTAGIQ